MSARLRLARRARAELPLLVELLGAMVVARAVVHLPFRRYARLVGRPGPGPPATIDPAAADLVRRVRWAIERLSRRSPGFAVCLPQALAAKWCLGRRGVPSTLHLGVLRRADDGRVGAHAWLTCGPLVVTGEGARGASTALAAYS